MFKQGSEIEINVFSLNLERETALLNLLINDQEKVLPARRTELQITKLLRLIRKRDGKTETWATHASEQYCGAMLSTAISISGYSDSQG